MSRDPIIQKRLDDYYAHLEWPQRVKTFDVADLLLKLPDLDRLTDNACDAANPTVRDAVNWGDLGCVESSLVIPLDGEPHFQVLVEEASPDAAEFQEFVRKYLEARGFPNVTVLTEW